MSDIVKQIQDHSRRRRASDVHSAEVVESFGQCPAFDDHSSIPRMIEILEKIAERQEEQAKKLEEVAEIVTAWNNTKGFIRTISAIGAVAKWLVGVGIACGLVWAWFKHSVQVK